MFDHIVYSPLASIILRSQEAACFVFPHVFVRIEQSKSQATLALAARVYPSLLQPTPADKEHSWRVMLIERKSFIVARNILAGVTITS